jgi:hypothetical protein
MRLKRRIAMLLALVMTFSSLAVFNVSADVAPRGVGFVPAIASLASPSDFVSDLDDALVLNLGSLVAMPGFTLNVTGAADIVDVETLVSALWHLFNTSSPLDVQDLELVFPTFAGLHTAMLQIGSNVVPVVGGLAADGRADVETTLNALIAEMFVVMQEADFFNVAEPTFVLLAPPAPVARNGVVFNVEFVDSTGGTIAPGPVPVGTEVTARIVANTLNVNQTEQGIFSFFLRGVGLQTPPANNANIIGGNAGTINSAAISTTQVPVTAQQVFTAGHQIASSTFILNGNVTTWSFDVFFVPTVAGFVPPDLGSMNLQELPRPTLVGRADLTANPTGLGPAPAPGATATVAARSFAGNLIIPEHIFRAPQIGTLAREWTATEIEITLNGHGNQGFRATAPVGTTHEHGYGLGTNSGVIEVGGNAASGGEFGLQVSPGRLQITDRFWNPATGVEVIGHFLSFGDSDRTGLVVPIHFTTQASADVTLTVRVLANGVVMSTHVLNINRPVAAAAGQVAVTTTPADAAGRVGSVTMTTAGITLTESVRGVFMPSNTTATGTGDVPTTTGRPTVRGFRITLDNQGHSFGTNLSANALQSVGLGAAGSSATNFSTGTGLGLAGGIATQYRLMFAAPDANGRIGYVDVIFPVDLSRDPFGTASITVTAGALTVNLLDRWSPNPSFGAVTATVQELAWYIEDGSRVANLGERASDQRPHGAFGSRELSTNNVTLGSLVQSDITFGAMGGTGAQTHRNDPNHALNTIVAGMVRGLPAGGTVDSRTNANVEISNTPSAAQLANTVINTAGVRLEHVARAEDAFNEFTAPITYRIVDSQGNPIEGVAIRGVWLGVGGASENTATGGYILNQVGEIRTNNVDGVNVIFGADNQSLMVTGVQRDVNALNARFALAVDVNVPAQTIYVEVFSPAGLPTDRIAIATVTPGVVVEIATTTAPVGFGHVTLNNIVISETRIGDFGTGGQLTIELVQPFGWASMSFAPTGTVSQTNLMVTTAGGGNTTIAASLTPVTAANNDSLVVNVARTGTINANTLPASVTISGITVISPFANVPAGAYGITVAGDLISNLAEANVRADGTSVMAGPTFRPWAMSVMNVEDVIRVGTGVGVITQTRTIGFSGAAAHFYIDGVRTPFVGGEIEQFGTSRNYVPLAALFTSMGLPAAEHVIWNEENRTVTTWMPGAPHPVVVWQMLPDGSFSSVVRVTRPVEGTLSFIEVDQSIPSDPGNAAAPGPRIPRLGTRPDNIGRTLVQAAAILELHGLSSYATQVGDRWDMTIPALPN